eukprot:2837061-Pleurochrysis_carterae.AAC.1
MAVGLVPVGPSSRSVTRGSGGPKSSARTGGGGFLRILSQALGPISPRRRTPPHDDCMCVTRFSKVENTGGFRGQYRHLNLGVAVPPSRAATVAPPPSTADPLDSRRRFP